MLQNFMRKLQTTPFQFKHPKYKWVVIVSLIGCCLMGLDKFFPLNLSRFNDRSPIILDHNHELLCVLLSKDERYRLAIKLEAVDPLFLQFLIAYEDKRYFYHFGVDFLALGRALWQWGRTGKVVSGGSTLSLQTIRLLEPRPRTVFSKCKEMLRAFQLEYHYSKREILEMYLSLAPFGGNLEGIRAASLSYFNKEPKQLTPSEAALLVALPQQPTRLRPHIFPLRARYHRDKVITRMESVGILTEHQAIEAKQDHLSIVKIPFPKLGLHLAHRLIKESPHNIIFKTTLNHSLQKQIETLLKHQISSLDSMHSIAVLVVDNKIHQVLAYVGSADFFDDKRCGQVDMVSAIRSPGSALKPFIYAMGFDAEFIHPETIIQDVATHFRDYTPSNFKDVFHGAVTIREALQMSLNVPAVAILEKIGAETFSAHLRSLGITLKFHHDMTNPSLPIALGGVGTRLFELIALYSALANDGQYYPLSYTLNSVSKSPIETLVSAEAAQAVTAILEEAPLPAGWVDWGATHHRPVAYKTGTSYGFRDALAIGYTQDHTIGVWLGRADGTASSEYTGRTHAAPILFKVFALLPQNPLYLKGSKVYQTQASRAPLPKALSRFRRDINGKIPQDTFQILFPKDGTTLSVKPEQVIPVSFKGGKAPFYVYENSRTLNLAIQKREILWKPKGPGFWELTVLDSEGHSAVSVIQVRAP